ncbi:adenosine deaminase-like protein [Drosophila serrata]|uniref:adenosine deaminase-like protein n=1 Tax=Drosophila serrata TaxID=7274 RepID=UPI000A1D071B|nr:adenosine deaminase-like protein [Drosophila serrata]XP_020811853.1 adenosine deaminase-like protein [Drosophila serrata]
MLQFLKELPKVELHAHLNGSLGMDSLCELAERLYGSASEEFSQLCARFTRFDKDSDLDACFEKFAFVHELTSTEEGLRYATELVVREFARDNVQYVELRTTPKANKSYTRREYLQHVIDAIGEARKTYPDILVKLLPSINRAEPVAVAEETVSLALEFAQSHPDLILGIDLSGNPGKGTFSDFVPILSLAREKGLKLVLHCAEIENPAEIKEMLNFGMSRCGHGTFLTPEDIELLKSRNIPIECCLTSNVKSGTVHSLEEHHLKRLMEADAPKVICTDDSGVFDTTLTQEFLLAKQTFGLTRDQCVSLTLEAVQHSFATVEERQSMATKVKNYMDSLQK